MNTNSANDLPCWAREALGHAGAPLAGDTDPEGRPYPRAGWCPEGFAERVAARWLEIKHDVLPPLAVLSDTGKGHFFRVMFGEGMRVAGDTPLAARAAVRQLDANRWAIAEKAAELARLLEDREDMMNLDLAWPDEMPDLFELIQSAAAGCIGWQQSAARDMQHLLALESSMSQPVPNLRGVLWSLASLDPQPAQATEPAFRTRQASQADHVRLLLDAIDRFQRRRADGLPLDDDDFVGGDAARLPADFALPDSALATLVSVVFDLPEGQPGVEAVRACRLSWRQGHDI